MIFSCSVYVMPELQFSYIYNAGKIPVQKFLESDFNIIFL